MDVLEEECDYGQYPACVGRVVEYGPEGQEQAGHWWWYWRRQGAENGLRFVWRFILRSVALPGIKEGFELDRDFFFLDAAWLNEGRCPGGRPSVSEN